MAEVDRNSNKITSFPWGTISSEGTCIVSLLLRRSSYFNNCSCQSSISVVMQAFRGVLNFGTVFIFEEEDIPILQDHGFGAKHVKPLRIRRESSGNCRNECIEPDLHPDVSAFLESYC